MPRIRQNRFEYAVTDFYIIVTGYMKKKKIKQRELCQLYGITQPGLSKKLSNANFTYKELLMLFEKLELTDDERLSLMATKLSA